MDNLIFEGENECFLNLTAARIKNEFIWNPTELSQNTTLILNDAEVGVFGDKGNIWPHHGKFLLNGFKYKRLGSMDSTGEVNIDWLLKRKDQHNFQPFEQLAEVLRSNGRNRLANYVVIEKERVRGNQMVGFSKYLNRFWDISVRYGFKPYRPLLIGLVVLIIGSVVFNWGYKNNLFIGKVSEDKSINFNAIVYSIDSFVPIINYHQEDARLPKADRTCELVKEFSCGKILVMYYWFHVTMGWILSTLFIVSFTSLVRRD